MHSYQMGSLFPVLPPPPTISTAITLCVCVCQTVRPAVRHVHMTAAAHAVCLELATSVHISTLLHPAVLVSLDLLTLEGKKSPAPYLIIPSPTFYDLLFSHHTSVTDRR